MPGSSFFQPLPPEEQKNSTTETARDNGQNVSSLDIPGCFDALETAAVVRRGPILGQLITLLAQSDLLLKDTALEALSKISETGLAAGEKQFQVQLICDVCERARQGDDKHTKALKAELVKQSLLPPAPDFSSVMDPEDADAIEALEKMELLNPQLEKFLETRHPGLDPSLKKLVGPLVRDSLQGCPVASRILEKMLSEPRPSLATKTDSTQTAAISSTEPDPFADMPPLVEVEVPDEEEIDPVIVHASR